MAITKNLGIWMDHSSAHLIEVKAEPKSTHTIESKFTHQVKEESLHKNENLMHNKENHQLAEYYNQIGESIKEYDNVLLFGPTDAKSELLNKLKLDHHFDKINIETRTTDKMTENQEHAFVNAHFNSK